ncbi:MAG TPA: SAM-dependent methyltransferase [Steroidobacteraceae bacterium]|nr:SAM-dependent methyltransferase [Steroidobacteraceae bacterium]
MLAARIRARIAAQGGWLPFAAFMQAALYEPELGYYMAGKPIFGAAGDFVTAPELSPLFAACLANGIADLLGKSDGGDVVELGAGSGAFAQHVLTSFIARGAPLERYRIVEPSPALAARQRERLANAPETAAHLDRFEWLAEPPAEPWQGVAFANEVIDALPVERFRVTRDGVDAIGVVASGDGFAWQPRPADAVLADEVESLQRKLPSRMPAGFASELRLVQRDWLAAASASLTHGAILVADYGLPRAQYYHLARDGGTLCGFHRHRRVDDVLAAPGAQDITAWVDFSALAEDAASSGLALGGFATQAHYLLETGIDRELARLTETATASERAAHRQAAETLLLPGEMGERFKLMALLRGIEVPILGFGFRDLSASL